jgi:hypothetical protein
MKGAAYEPGAHFENEYLDKVVAGSWAGWGTKQRGESTTVRPRDWEE